MSFLIGTFVLLMTVLCITRSISLSRHSTKFTEVQVWKGDVLSKYGWIAGGLALIGLAFYKQIDTMEITALILLWLLGIFVIWVIPSRLSKIL